MVEDLVATWRRKHELQRPKKLRIVRAPQIFANILRQQIFQYLCAHPCSSLSAIAERFRISVPTIKYHVDKLIATEYLSKSITKGKTVFYPTSMFLQDSEELRVLSFLNSSSHAQLFKIIAGNPGISRKELFGLLETGVVQKTDRRLHALTTAGLLTTVRDGRLKRYFPSMLLARVAANCVKRVPMFRKQFIRKLGEEGFDIRIQHVSAESFTIWLSCGGRRYILVIRTEPFQTIFE